MEEIKRRMRVADEIACGRLHTIYKLTTAEAPCLQIRTILELIALSGLVANKAAYEKHRQTFHRDWHAKRILKVLEKANPDFYPVPGEQVLDQSTGKVVEVKPIASGYLSRRECEALYDMCCAYLHAHNPFSEDRRDPDQMLREAPSWIAKIRVLLNHHQMRLVGGSTQIWTVMQCKGTGAVGVHVFEKVG